LQTSSSTWVDVCSLMEVARYFLEVRKAQWVSE
jgi:hypothetical protein